MSIEQIISFWAKLTLIEMMIAIGLGVTLENLMLITREPLLVLRAMLANYICVPSIALGLLILFHTPPMVSAGILVAAACPGAPFGPPFTALAKGNVPAAVGLMVVLAGSSAIIAPFLLNFLLQKLSDGAPLQVRAGKMLAALAISQFLPLCAGIIIREKKPGLANNLEKPLARLSTVLNLILLGLILVDQFNVLMRIRLLAYLGMLALVIGSLIAGWLFGGTSKDNRKTMAIATSVRNVGVGLVIATTSFPGAPAITAITVFALLQTCLLALIAFLWGQMALQKRSITASIT